MIMIQYFDNGCVVYKDGRLKDAVFVGKARDFKKRLRRDEGEFHK